MIFNLDGVNTLEKINMFIRCLWSELRVNRAKFGLNY